MTTIALAQIVWRQYEPKHVSCLIDLVQSGIVSSMLTQQGDALVSRARSILATRFLTKHDEQVLVTVDSDVIFKPDDVRKIAEAAHEHHGIVGGLYMCRAMQDNAPTSILPDGVEISVGDPDAPLVPVRWLAAGFMAIDRGVFEALADGEDVPLYHAGSSLEMYGFYDDIRQDAAITTWVGKERIYPSEDYALCEQASIQGFPILLDPSIRLGHVGQWTYEVTQMPGATGWPVKLKRDGYRVEVLR